MRFNNADHARKIYLAGALNLTAVQRKYLESINICPIDLWDAVKDFSDSIDDRHQEAIRLFLKAMKDEGQTGQTKKQPHEWKPSELKTPTDTEKNHTRQFKDHEYAASLLKAQLKTLQQNRESYPAWLVCPSHLQSRIQNQLHSPYPSAENIAALAPNDRAKLLYEIAWQYSITFEYIFPWMVEEMMKVCNPDNPILNSDKSPVITKRQQMEIALVLLKNSHWLEAGAENEDDKSIVQKHIQSLTQIFEKNGSYLPDYSAELTYQQALIARDAFDYAKLEELVDKISGVDSIWKLRKAALLEELGRLSEREELIKQAYGELREKYLRDKNSIPLLSKLMWAHSLFNSLRDENLNRIAEKLPNFAENHYREWECDPWSLIDNIRENAREKYEKYLEQQNPIQPLFEQGCYRDNSEIVTFGGGMPLLFKLEGIMRQVGLPLYSSSSFLKFDVFAKTAEKLLIADKSGFELFDCLFAIRASSSENSNSIKSIFSRIGVAKISQTTVDTLVSRLLLAINYWKEKRIHGTTEQKRYAINVLPVFMEILARLVIRVSVEKAKEIFRLSVNLGKKPEFQHHWLFNSLKSLVTNSLGSIPKSEQGELLVDALEFPLQAEIGHSNVLDECWANPVIQHTNERQPNARIDARIKALIDLITPTSCVAESAFKADNVLPEFQTEEYQKILKRVENESKFPPRCVPVFIRLLPLFGNNYLTEEEKNDLAQKIWGNNTHPRTLPVTGLLPHGLLLLPMLPPKEQVESLVRQKLYDSIIIDECILEGIINAAANQETRLFPTPEQASQWFDKLVTWRPELKENDILRTVENTQKRLANNIGNALFYAIMPALKNKTVEQFEQLKLFFEEVKEYSVIPAFVYFVSVSDDIENSIEKVISRSLYREKLQVAYATIALQKWAELPNAKDNIKFNNLILKLIDVIESRRIVGMQYLLNVAGELFEKQMLSEDQINVLIESISEIFNTMDYGNIKTNEDEIIASSLREACVKLASLIHKKSLYNTLQTLLEKAKNDPLPEVRFAVKF